MKTEKLFPLLISDADLLECKLLVELAWRWNLNLGDLILFVGVVPNSEGS